MATKVEPRVPRGMRDILPEQMVRRQYVMDVIRGVFEEFGFEPLQTPALELEETLTGKYGPEAERLIYSATYGGKDERLMLRYDLSVPLSRVVAMYPNLPKPFKRYHLAPVWRADRPQRGRWREFYQCDVDTVGSTSMLADAETVAVIYTVLYRLGFRKFKVNINNRKLLNGLGQFAGVPAGLLKELYQSVDKLPKIGVEGVKQEMLAAGLPDPIRDAIRKVARLYLQGKVKLDALADRLAGETLPGSGGPTLFPADLVALVTGPLRGVLAAVPPGSVESDRLQDTAGELINAVTPALRAYYGGTRDLIPEAVVEGLLPLLDLQGDNRTILASLRAELAAYPTAVEGIDELETILRYLEALGVPEQYVRVDISMARGLEYYTGSIYETVVEEANVGSVTGGGRFDNLVGMFTERSLPAVGTTIGIERLIAVMEEQEMFPPNVGRTTVQVLVAAFAPELLEASIALGTQLRAEGLRVQTYFEPIALREQIGYANTKGIPVIAIIGPDEAAQGQVTVRNLATKQQQTVASTQAATVIRGWVG